ncbi:unnamed protein product [Mycena citricolor]|uniref:NADP-dependent oxidoreductase domain-containing protein n=2 Tax=Mycena citricolor TaxID=2018698 RepID=A0AAD2HL00_9AGAR|nr:unnamed protein product [Mycena citricolor]
MSSTQTTPQRRVGYVRLGNSGLKVSQIILGCMSYGSPEWRSWILDEEETAKHIKHAYEAGIQTFDTANVYSNGMSEVALGKAIKKLGLPREELVIMTKVRHPVGKTADTNAVELFVKGPDNCGYVNQHGLSRKHIFDSVQASLKRLQVDYIDVLQCHRFDYATPIEETMKALHDVVQAGYVRYIGMSSCFAWQFHVMQNYAITNHLTPFISMSNQYSLLHREEEREMMPTLKHFGVGSIPWSPLARGALTRPYAPPSAEAVQAMAMIKAVFAAPGSKPKQPSAPPSQQSAAAVATETAEQARVRSAREDSDELPADVYFALSDGSKPIVERLEEIAKKHKATMAQVALAWVMAKDSVSAPIVGTTSLSKLDDLIGAVNVHLSEEEMEYLEEPYKPMGHLLYN